jgi:hypothetical protein
MSYAGDPQGISEAEVDAFCEKLDQWARGLAPPEQALARLMLARARRNREVEPEGVTYESKEAFDELIDSVFRTMARRKVDYEFASEVGAAFAKESGPSWVKGGWVDTADISDVEPIIEASTIAAAASPDLAPDDDAASVVPVFGRHLEAYARTLEPRDRLVLRLLILRAMDPVERIRWTSPADLLDEGQEALLQDLAER